ncbi:hypothetical protein LC653_36500 [Nostoc sp. CHAB 5784]|uniref:protein-tyrosine phosphatase family protein n=1 Tax=Nostoc mirabile TaxID=2907820 RepID=UPI001E64C368|nr:protein-tyrosine phosphatase family protein [Nostoc mirabile]MCC5669199.1 hypothetical protein [Nostoc mirabile CHAB5784]
MSKSSSNHYKVPIPNSYWVLPEQFLAGEHPMLLIDLPLSQRIQAFFDTGISLFINLIGEEEENNELGDYLPLLESFAVAHSRRIECRRFPIPDLQIPPIEVMVDILNTIDRALNAQEKVYVHCWGGIGRTGIVVGCYLVRHGITGKTALSEIARLREHTRDYRYPSPTQLSQEQMILNWRIGQ